MTSHNVDYKGETDVKGNVNMALTLHIPGSYAAAAIIGGIIGWILRGVS